ncbi:MAG: DUF2892 domain-containing protein [Nanoarchaeota archaeon]|nr:DUF2892 domain-containing protein [Nanoarchaeota archaeon]
MCIKPNVGTTDRILRIVAGLAIAGAAYYYKIWWLYLIALGLLATGTIAYCLLYALLGINTCGCKKEESKPKRKAKPKKRKKR